MCCKHQSDLHSANYHISPPLTMFRIFPAVTATKIQTATYLVGVALFSISLLVFLNASISFIVTDVIGRKHGVGNVVGTLGFADELLALVACPAWGLLSDRIGVRNVTVLGYCIIVISFFTIVQCRNVYPQLLLGRLCFSLGGAACSTMVTAILPALTLKRAASTTSRTASDARYPVQHDDDGSRIRHSGNFSISSELTITPARYDGSTGRRSREFPRSQTRALSSRLADRGATQDENASTVNSQLAGYVGMFTGIGALLAVAVFLPLPAAIAGDGTSKADAVKDSFYIVACIALLVGFLVFFGLRGLPGDENKGFRNLFAFTASSARKENDTDDETTSEPVATLSYLRLMQTALVLAFTDSRIALGYLGGFVARASSVGISLFIPLFVNAYFIRTGLCTNGPGEDIKSSCRRAYTLASMLTGFAELAALLCAPLFGYFNGRMSKTGFWAHLPISIGAAAGIVGCIAFGLLDDPDPFAKDTNGSWAVLAVILLGISQISAIVCSLGSLARGVQSATADGTDGLEPRTDARSSVTEAVVPAEAMESAPLLTTVHESQPETPTLDRTQLKGSIAGVYSLFGGLGILLLTKVGGVLFDRTSPGSPFFMLAGFNGILLIAAMAITFGQQLRQSKLSTEG